MVGLGMLSYSEEFASSLSNYMTLQELVAKNEALRRMIHELHTSTNQELKRKEAQGHEQEQQLRKPYEAPSLLQDSRTLMPW